MNYGQVFYVDTANGIGCRTSLFVSGCTHHCEECFNQETWDFDYGVPFDRAAEDDIIEHLKPAYIDGLSLLGGEPMELSNQKVLRPFLERVKAECPRSTVWIYSGYTYEELTDPENRRCRGEDTDAILSMTDILIDGEFKRELKDITLRFRGSSNQRIIDVRKTRETGEIVLSPYMEPRHAN